MADFFNWLIGGSISSILFIVIVSIVGIGAPLIFILAFFQGREIILYPPKIGAKPDLKNKTKFTEQEHQSSLVFLEDYPPGYKAQLESANEVWLVGVSLHRTLDYILLRQKAEKGHTLRVLLVDPDGYSPRMIANRYVLEEKRKPEKVIRDIRTTLNALQDLQVSHPETFEIRTIDYPLAFGATAINPTSPIGKLILEDFPYKAVSDSIPKFVLTANDKWYKQYIREIQSLWKDGTTYKHPKY